MTYDKIKGILQLSTYLLTCIPFFTKFVAIAAPIPELTPVTTATFPAHLLIDPTIFIFELALHFSIYQRDCCKPSVANAFIQNDQL